DRELAHYNVGAAVDWYCNHIGYDYGLQAGKDRINLDGKLVGKVTLKEATEAKKRVDSKHEMMNKQKARNPQATPVGLYNGGENPNDQLSKVNAPAPKKKVKDAKTKPDQANQALGKTKETLDLEDGDLKTSLVQVALGIAGKLIKELEQEEISTSLEVLESFMQINPSLHLQEGTEQVTINHGTARAVAKVSGLQPIPTEIAF